MIAEQKYVRDVTFTCGNLTLFEGIFLKTIVEAFQKGKQVKIETDEDFEKRMKHE
jgi:hypothetical protein